MVAPARLVAHRALRRFVDVGLGWRLMRDPAAPAGRKLLALCLGLGVTALIVGLEIPAEAVFGLLAPLLGLAADVAFDGAELLLLPLLIALAALPHLMPKDS